jgi:hypothetical protein
VSRLAKREAAIAQFPRLAMMLAHPSAPAPVGPAAATATAGVQDHAESITTHASLRSPAITPPALPPQELSRVTEHVLRTLDRRVLSYRERTGRI